MINDTLKMDGCWIDGWQMINGQTSGSNGRMDA